MGLQYRFSLCAYNDVNNLFSDFVIKVVQLDENEQKSFKGHQAPVLSVALDPKDTYMVNILFVG